MSVARAPKKNKKRNPQTAATILEGALEVFGERGFEDATVSAICKAASVSDATLYEYFDSKEDVLFAISEQYTRRELERMREIARYVHTPREKLRVIIQAYLEFYENNPLYTSVALLTLKANRRFAESPAYQVIRDSTRNIVEVVREGMDAGVFHDDLDPYLVRNMLLGFIEHLTIGWLLVGRPEHLSAQRDTVFEMIMRVVEAPPKSDGVELKVQVTGPKLAELARLLGA